VAVSCVQEEDLPGQLIGKFQFAVSFVDAGAPTAPGCAYKDIPAEVSPFTATFTEDGGAVFYTMGGSTSEATFDGQLAEATREAPREFAECACEGVRLRETIRVTLMSLSQTQALGNQCPENPFAAGDGGVPQPEPDSGVTLPRRTEFGFDAVKACGELVNEIIAPDECGCSACTLLYRVDGSRR
jgi:hypothetical protein